MAHNACCIMYRMLVVISMCCNPKQPSIHASPCPANGVATSASKHSIRIKNLLYATHVASPEN